MKKYINLLCILFLCCGFLTAQQSSNIANRNTALRCLKLGENCLMAGDWNNAYNQALLGISYDDSISDLFYIKAAAETNLNKTKNETISDIETAFEKNHWVGNTVNGARILYADLLSDIGRYSKSMKVLDESPFIFSADGEFIRIKNLYRIGTAESINDARLKVNSSRRVYKDDSRFPNIFFMFELLYLLEADRLGINYTIPEIVNTIASSYIVNLPDYTGNNLAIELMASFFASKEEQYRLVKAIDAKGKTNNPVLAIAGLKAGIYTQEQAFNMFFDMSGDSIALGLLESLCLLISEDNVKKMFIEKLNNFNGLIISDTDLDLEPELFVKYETGRPLEISYDYNNDDKIDLYSVCDFGAPKTIYVENNDYTITYSSFPKVQQIKFNDKNFAFNYLDSDFIMSPIELPVNSIFNTLGLEFYFPVISKEIVIPPFQQLEKIANTVELPITERENGRIVYTILEGQPLFADFYQGESKYAYSGFSKGFPFVRNIDQDLDGYFETTETFNIADNDEDFVTEEESEYVKSVFGPIPSKDNIYQSKIQIDRNGNNFYEFTEEYLGLNGKITTWDNNDDGIIDSQYIRYPFDSALTKHDLKEDSVFFDKNGEPYISINFINKVPVKMNLQESEVIIYAGENNNFYWIEEEGSSELENYIMENIVPKLNNGIINIENIGEDRFSIILVNDVIFCKKIPVLQSDETEQ